MLVFVPNDFVNNHPLWMAFDSRSGPDPEHLPYVSAARTEDGGFRLRPPDPDYRRRMLPSGAPTTPQWKTFAKQALGVSWFFEWLQPTAGCFFVTKTRFMPNRCEFTGWSC